MKSLIVNSNCIDNLIQALSFAHLYQEVSRYIDEISLLLQIRKGYGKHLQRLMEDTEKARSLGGTTHFFLDNFLFPPPPLEYIFVAF